MHLIVFTRNNIHVCQVLDRLIFALEIDSKVFHEILKPLLDAESSENIVRPSFNLDEDSPIPKKAIINLNCE